MILNNIKSMKKDRGFTIVELLVVIVVIGILAAITIVSYTGITQKANTTKAQSNAQSAQTVAEIIAADNGGVYPATTGAFATGSETTQLPAGINILVGLPGVAGVFTESTGVTELLTSSNGATSVGWACLTTCTDTTGGRLTYWDFTTGARSTNVIYVGVADVTGTFVAPAS